MWPLVHPAVGYLLYAGVVRATDGRPPGDRTTPVVVLGALLPDLLDLPVRWAGLGPDVRLLGHTLLFVGPVLLVAWWVARRAGTPRLALAFAIGLASHLAADALWPLLYGDVHELGFVLWPVTESRPYEPSKPIATVGGFDARWVEYGLLGVGLGCWLRDGTPGTGWIRS